MEMRRFWLGVWVLFVLVTGVGCGGTAQAAPPRGPGDVDSNSADSDRGEGPSADGKGKWLSAETEQRRYPRHGSGETDVAVWVKAPDCDCGTRRTPMAVSLVIDTSGSMSGDRIDHARRAAADVIRRLRDGDIVSIIGFESQVHEWVEPTRLTSDTRPKLMARVRSLEAAGGTNMYAGLALGEQRLKDAPGTHRVRRVMLISDGHANEGPSDAYSLGMLAAQGTDYGVQVTAIGVGDGYNEEILNTLAVRSAGRLYHLSHPSQMAQILEDELDRMGTTVAVDVRIEITPAPGVEILGVETLGAEFDGERVRMNLGSLIDGEKRAVLLRARVNTDELGNRPAATAKLFWRGTEPGAAAKSEAVRAGFTVVADSREAAGSESAKVRGLRASVDAARVQSETVSMLNDGDYAGAAAKLDYAADQLESAAAAAPAKSYTQQSLAKKAESMRSASRRAKAAPSSPGGARDEALENNAASLGGLMGAE